MTIRRLLMLLSTLHEMEGKPFQFHLYSDGQCAISRIDGSQSEKIVTLDLGMVDVVAWLIDQVGDNELVPTKATLPQMEGDFTTAELRTKFEKAIQILKHERTMRNHVFKEGHPERYTKLQDIQTVIDTVVWMKNLLKPMSIPDMVQAQLIEIPHSEYPTMVR